MKRILYTTGIIVMSALLAACNADSKSSGNSDSNSNSQQSASAVHSGKSFAELWKEDPFELRTSDAEINRLKGRIKSLHVTTYHASSYFGEPRLDSIRLAKRFGFNNDGYITHYSLEMRTDSFDRDYNRVRYTEHKYENCAYTLKGNKKTITVTDKNDKILRKIVKTLNDAGMPIKREEYDCDGKLTLMNKYSYDSDGRLKERSSYGEDGATVSRLFDIRYNSCGLVESYTNLYDFKEKKGATYSFKYTDGWLLLEQIEHDYNDNDSYTTRYEHTDGKLSAATHTSFDKDGKEESKSISKLDQHGNTIEHLFYYENKLESQTRSEHKYDSHGNVIETIRYKDGEPTEVTKYTYEYYE